MTDESSKRYDASVVESKWYQRWEEAGLFQPDPDRSKPSYTITIPPPNITGSLHMGHALCYSLQDMLGRYKRLRGYRVLILPGQDHAGIATQSVVEKQLRKQGTSGAQLGREKFLEKVWEWRKESGDTILSQFRTMGCAFDWQRTRFTLDDRYVKAVMNIFIEWFDRGLIYRGKRVVNWDPVLKTSVSDIETERRLIKGKLYYIRYPFADGSGHIVIATTRPETMLADVAVAVHPSDARYKGLVGKALILPLLNREIPLISDIYPDPEFGSGAVKITPAHDPNDFQVGQRHGLPMPVLLDESAKITAEGGQYAGLDRLEARKRVVEDLEAAGLLEKIEDHEIPIIVGERSGEAIEPLLSEQWFADQSALAQPVIEAVQGDRIKFVPDRYKRIFLEWLENVHDWTLSRQLWWGHRIPIYYTEDGTAVAAHSWEEAEQKAGQKIVSQDNDVLDTWFSSGLWPFATLGWPEDTDDLKEFYPTDCLVTSREIIYLWVARMAMMGLDQLKDIPFRDVYIYATVLTEDGKRMSKSLGTGIDPGEVIEKKGTDALRFALLSQTGFNQDLRYGDRKSDDARNFCNKIWNAVRFVILNTGDIRLDGPLDSAQFLPEDKWLMSRLSQTAKEVEKGYESYDIQSVCQTLYRFFWSEVCDWYIEVSKHRLQQESQREIPIKCLLACFETFLKLLHPVMPFITEEIYSLLPIQGKAGMIMQAEWPSSLDSYANATEEARVERWFAITRALRALRAGLSLEPGRQISEAYFEGDLNGGEAVVASQAWLQSLRPGHPEVRCLSTTVEGVDLHLPIGEDVDLDKVVGQIEREEGSLAADLAKVEAQLQNPNFVDRAKPEVVAKQRELATELTEKLLKTRQRLDLFRTK